MCRGGLIALLIAGCTSSTAPTTDTGATLDLAPDVASDDVVTDAGAPDEDAPVAVDVASSDAQRICPVVARAGEACGALEGLVCTGTRVCTPCGAFAYEYFEQQCVCMTGMWQCGGHSDCGPTARCGYFSDAVCTSPYPCGGVDGGADAGDASDDVFDGGVE